MQPSHYRRTELGGDTEKRKRPSVEVEVGRRFRLRGQRRSRITEGELEGTLRAS